MEVAAWKSREYSVWLKPIQEVVELLAATAGIEYIANRDMISGRLEEIEDMLPQ